MLLLTTVPFQLLQTKAPLLHQHPSATLLRQIPAVLEWLVGSYRAVIDSLRNNDDEPRCPKHISCPLCLNIGTKGKNLSLIVTCCQRTCSSGISCFRTTSGPSIVDLQELPVEVLRQLGKL